MANKKVSELSATTESNDNVWLIMNNSGETETFKIQRKDLLSGTTTPSGFIRGTATNSIVPFYYPASSGTSSATTYVDKLFVVENEISSPDNNIYISSTNLTKSLILGDSHFVAGGKNNVLSSLRGEGHVIIGGKGNTKSSSGLNNIGDVLIGGLSNQHLNTSFRGVIIGGQSNILSSSQQSAILGGTSNNITTSQQSAILGGSNNTITTHNNSVMLGGSNNTSLYEDTAHAEHLLTYGQINNGYFDNASGNTFTIDWNKGNSQKVFMTGDTSFDFTNVRNGATYKLQIVNGGSFDITGATASGFTILCEGGSVPNITNNGVDLCVLEVMGTDILVRHFAGFAAP